VIPRSFVKNGLDRYVVLNRVAKSVIDGCRGAHATYVFTCEGEPVARIYNSGRKAANVFTLSKSGSDLLCTVPLAQRSNFATCFRVSVLPARRVSTQTMNSMGIFSHCHSVRRHSASIITLVRRTPQA
jgi:hypothetical protein